MIRGGYPTDLFINSPDSSLICACCIEVLRDPVQCPNGHLFCRTCIAQALQYCERCPTCRCNLDSNQLCVSLIARQMVGTLKTRCTSSKLTHTSCRVVCKWSGSVEDLDMHLAQDCALQMVRCPHRGCRDEVPRHFLHQHKQNCNFRRVACSYCNEQLIFLDLQRHVSRCSFRPVRCENGCGAQTALHNLDEHYNRCPLEPLVCPYFSTQCGASCNGWVLRKDWECHIQDKACMKLVIGALFDKVDTLEAEKERLEDEIQRLTSYAHSSADTTAAVCTPRRYVSSSRDRGRQRIYCNHK